MRLLSQCEPGRRSSPLEPNKRTSHRGGLLFGQAADTDVQRLRKTSRASVRQHGSAKEFLKVEFEMNFLIKILANKLFALLLLIGVGVWLLVIPAFTGSLGANPLEKLLHQSGEIAIWTLGAVLALSPLRVLLPRARIVNALNRHRRAIGVSACVYGLLHFGLHVLYEGGLDGLARSLSKPFIWFGVAGLSTLVALALTSNNWSIRALGGKKWKLLHRLAYAAARWVDDHGECLYRYALVRVRKPEVAEDLVQETFLAGVRGYEKFEARSSERSWLVGILKNKIVDHFRKLGRETSFTDMEFLSDEFSEKFVSVGFWDHDKGPHEWKPEPDEVMHRAEFWQTMRDCLAKLPQKVGDVFTMREMDDVPSKEICAMLSISDSNLWVMLHRARMALRECLEMNWFDKPAGGRA